MRILAAAVAALTASQVLPPGRAAPADRAGLGLKVSAATVGGRPTGPGAGRLTLITGDWVLIQAASVRPVASASAGSIGDLADRVSVTPAAGRAGIGFSRFVKQGHLFVLPSDAAALVGSGRVDRRLFDVTVLLASGYDDGSRSDLPLLVSYPDSHSAGTARTRLAVAGVVPTRDLSSVDAVAVRVGKAATPTLWTQLTGVAGSGPRAAGARLAAGVNRLWLDGRVRATLDRSVPQIGAPAAWAAGHTGRGVTVAVLDTGIDAGHPDLADAVVASQDFTGSPSGTADVFGHGTHVASIITGSGAASGGRYAGVAPDARLVVGKVLDDSGNGFDSQIIAAMEWAATEQHAAVVNMSLGGGFPSDGTELLDQAVDRLTAQTGTLFVASAGNSGPEPGSISSPGAATAALTVGAVDEHDVLAEFSSRGPRRGDDAIKPDLTAPGVDIVAARASGSTLGDPVDESYQRLSGTSMAAPHVAGAAAILAGQHPDWRAAQLTAALVGSATETGPASVFEQGAGRVDIARASSQPVLATPAVVGFGIARWPHADDPVAVRTVTYRNTGPDPVTLDLDLDMRDPGGRPAAAGMFRLAASRLTVPAGGDAGITLAADTAVDGPDGNYRGVLTATASGGRAVGRVRTPVAVTREVESHTVTLTVRDGAGRPTPNYLARLASADVPAEYWPYDASGTTAVRVPAGDYLLDVSVTTPAGQFAMVAVEPRVVVNRDLTLVIDSRAGQRAGTVTDHPEAGVMQSDRRFLLTTSWGETGSIYATDHDFLVRPSQTAAAGFRYSVADRQARPDRAGGFTGSPYYYHVAWSVDDRVPNPPRRRVHDRDLAAVPMRISDTRPPPDRTTWLVALLAVAPPTALTAYYTPGVPMGDWLTQYRNRDEFTVDAEVARRHAFQPGHNPTERWNAAVFGPAFPIVDNIGPWATREQDRLVFNIPLYSDSDADHFGYSTVDDQTTTLSRDGREVGAISTDSDPASQPAVASFSVPAEAGTYRLEASANRSVSALSTRIKAAWTFRSATTTGEQPLPLLAVRFDPALDNRNQAPPGAFPLRVWVQRQAAAEQSPLASLTVQVSYDDGATWRAASVTGSANRRTVHLIHPVDAAYVSLRTTATDTAGRSVEETIIHAYAIGSSWQSD